MQSNAYIQDNETLTTLMKVDIQPCYKQSLLKRFCYKQSLLKRFEELTIFEEHCSFMFDSGSQKSYITADLKKELHLKAICNEKIIIKTFEST